MENSEEKQTKQEDNKTTKSTQEWTQEPKKENRKKTSKKKIIIIIAIIIVLLAGIAAGVWFYLSNKEDNETLDWGKVYLEVLNDTDKLEDMNNQKIQICDLEKDSIPELTIYGNKDDNEYIANIYKINDNNEVDTIRVSLDNEFDLNLIYDSNKDDYVWYAVSEQEDNTTKIYNLNFENSQYTPEEVTLNLGVDSIKVDNNYSEKIDFDKNSSEDAKKEILDQAIDKYVPVENMITDEVREKVEDIKLLKNIKKIDPSKDIVYTVEEYKSTTNGDNYKYPAINIDADNVKQINSEIENLYGFKASDYSTNGFILSPETEESGYKYYINGHILSLVVYNGGNDSVWSTAYNINLQDYSTINSDVLLQEKGLNKDEVIAKAYESAEKKMQEVIENDKTAVGSYWDTMYPVSETSTWEAEMKDSIDKLANVYLNENGDFCILADLEHAGGQYSCNKNIIINVSDNYSVEELLLDVWNGEEQNLSPIPQQTTETTETTGTTEATSQSSSTNSNIKGIIGLDQMKTFTYEPSYNVPLEEGTYTGPMGTLKITNSTGNTFDFEFACEKQTSAGYGPNLGSMQGTAKAITGNGNFVFSEEKTVGSYSYKYNVFFYTYGNSITVYDECYDNITGKTDSPYCGNGVMFSGTYTK